MDKTRIKFYQV